ncbi:V-type ATPase 116kDa subunit family protein [archaeon]|nr:MAG: V-type ATPase 116kDa subunit family protein [archaeon]
MMWWSASARSASCSSRTYVARTCVHTHVTRNHVACACGVACARVRAPVRAVRLQMNGDLTAFKRYYTPLVRRCDEIEKKIRFFEDEMAVYEIEPEVYTNTEFETWLSHQRTTLAREHRGLSLLDYWESIITDKHKDYQGIKAAREATASRLYEAVQRRLVIENAKDFFLEATASVGGRSRAADVELTPVQRRLAGNESGMASMEDGAARDDSDEMSFKHIAGIIATDDKARFGRIVFRASAGHAVVRFADIEQPLMDEKRVKHVKSVFTIFFRGRALTTKLDRICSAFNAHQHDIPPFENEAAVTRALEETRRVMEECMTWLSNEADASSQALRHMALVIRKWRTGVVREKAIYHTLNMFQRHSERGSVTAQAWVLKTEVDQVHQAINDAHMAAANGGRVQPFFVEVVRGDHLPQPPTHFHTNKFTRAFQGFVNTYGVPRYGEANPALFAIITFPFLFGVMYGDIGHATVLTIAAAYIVWREDYFNRRKLNEMFVMTFGGRYMLLLMGIFSIYCGFVYNDLFSVATSAFNGTRWYYPHYRTNHTTVNETIIVTHTATEAIKKEGWDDVYPFGVDPAWHAADNKLLFFNSMKMKMSVIFGIVQMMGGLVLKLLNAMYYKNMIDVFCECIPQIVFMTALFGYMVFLIVYKWVIDWNDPLTAPGAPPSLIDTLINIVLKPGSVPDPPMYNGQAGVQTFILLLVFFMVPIMLIVKPLLVRRQNKAHKNEETRALVTDTEGVATNPVSAASSADVNVAVASADTHDEAHGGDDHAHSFGEMFIHQAIETIEFVLGSVSNTASYLRLWALSLAHSQLATVFWERALVATVEMDNAVIAFVGFAVWAGVSFGVLMCMDVLECFLHALRLHWVEFQNKFYKADGYKFMPFSFAALSEELDKQ